MTQDKLEFKYGQPTDYAPAYTTGCHEDKAPNSSTDIPTITIQSIGPFSMRKPLTFEVENLDDGVVLSCDEADIYASGSDLSEAKEDIVHQLQFAWKEYALCDDDELDGVAKRYKRWLLDNIVKNPIE